MYDFVYLLLEGIVNRIAHVRQVGGLFKRQKNFLQVVFGMVLLIPHLILSYVTQIHTWVHV